MNERVRQNAWEGKGHTEHNAIENKEHHEYFQCSGEREVSNSRDKKKALLKVARTSFQVFDGS